MKRSITALSRSIDNGFPRQATAPCRAATGSMWLSSNSGQDNDRRATPKRAQSREEGHAMAARIDIDNKAVDAVEFALRNPKASRPSRLSRTP